MQSIGKTILVELPDVPDEITEGGIIIPGARSEDVVHYTGIVKNYGTSYSDDELTRISNEIPIGKKVYFDWKVKNKKTKIRFNQHWYMIIPEELILGIEENE